MWTRVVVEKLKITPHEAHTRDKAPSNVGGFLERVLAHNKINDDKQPREPKLTNVESEQRPGSNAHAVQRLVHTLRGRNHHHVTKQKSEDQSRRPTTIVMVSQACRKRCGH